MVLPSRAATAAARSRRVAATRNAICGEVSAAPGAQLGVGDLVGLLGVAEHGLQVGVSEAFTDGGQAHPTVDHGGGVGMPQLVQRRGHSRGVAVLGPAGLGGGVTQRASDVVFLRAEQRPDR